MNLITLKYSEEAAHCLTEVYSNWSDEDKFDMCCKANTFFQKINMSLIMLVSCGALIFGIECSRVG